MYVYIIYIHICMDMYIHIYIYTYICIANYPRFLIPVLKDPLPHAEIDQWAEGDKKGTCRQARYVSYTQYQR